MGLLCVSNLASPANFLLTPPQYIPRQNTGCSHETTIHSCPLADLGSPEGTVVHCTITQDGSYADDGFNSRNMFVRLLEDLTPAQTTNQTDRLLSIPPGGGQLVSRIEFRTWSAYHWLLRDSFGGQVSRLFRPCKY